MQENLLSLLWVSHWVPYCFKTQSREIKPANLGAKNSLKQTGAFSIVFNTLQKPALLVFILGLDFFSDTFQISTDSVAGSQVWVLSLRSKVPNFACCRTEEKPPWCRKFTHTSFGTATDSETKFQIKFMSKFTDSRNTLMVFWAKANGSTAAF